VTPAYAQTPQVFPAANLMNPCSPHPVPQEFLIFQFPPTLPTNSTAWLIDAAQLLKTPLEYLLQLVASTVTETGLELIPFCNPAHPGWENCPEILKLPPLVLQA
jgi:hypothetical protein